MTIVKSLLEWATQELSAASASPRLDAELIFSHVSDLSRVEIISGYFEQVDAKLEELFRALVARRKLSEPVAYLTGQREFYNLDFEVTSKVLIPRPETELLVELAVEAAERLARQIRILDLGTGSGCIAVAIAVELKRAGINFEITAVDADSHALEVARRNAARHNVLDRLSFVESDWFSALSAAEQRFDIIVSNPPYISEGDKEVSPEIFFEPGRALFAGTDGLDSIRTLLKGCRAFLNSPGLFYCEMGHRQRISVENLFNEIFNRPGEPPGRLNFSTDLAGRDRVFALEF